MSARVEIMRTLTGRLGIRDRDMEAVSDDVLSDLTSAGYRLVAPGQLDNETLEAAAKVAEDECRAHNTGSGFDSQPAYAASYRIAATIRSMKEKG